MWIIRNTLILDWYKYQLILKAEIYRYRIGSENRVSAVFRPVLFWQHDSHAKKIFILHKTRSKSCFELSVSVFLHHFGLGSLRKTVDCDGDVRAAEHLFQNLRHFVPLQPIQATADAAWERRGGGERVRLRARDGDRYCDIDLGEDRTRTAASTLWSLRPVGTATPCPPGCTSGCRRSACRSLFSLWPATPPRDKRLKRTRLAREGEKTWFIFTR